MISRKRPPAWIAAPFAPRATAARYAATMRQRRPPRSRSTAIARLPGSIATTSPILTAPAPHGSTDKDGGLTETIELAAYRKVRNRQQDRKLRVFFDQREFRQLQIGRASCRGRVCQCE